MLNKFESYVYGLILTDGSIYLTTRNRGKITIELKRQDEELLLKLQKQIPHSKITRRTRNTNFKQNSETSILSNYQKEFRDFFLSVGIPSKNKSIIGTIPNTLFSESDFWRGVIDGNGSLGYTNNNEPFVSLVVKSEMLKDAFLELINIKFNIRKCIKPNTRDNVYNIILKNENAIDFLNFIYTDADIYMLRKYDMYLKIKNWKRTKKKSNHNAWTDYEINYIQNHTVDDCMSHLNRSKQSIKMKLWRLSQSNKTNN